MFGLYQNIYMMEKKIRFNDHVQICIVPFEERKGIWMQYAIDSLKKNRKNLIISGTCTSSKTKRI